MAFLSVVTTVRATSQEDFRYDVYKSNGTAYIEKYIGSSAVVDVPSSIRADSGDRDDDGNPIYRNYTVKYINMDAFLENTTITHVTLPSTLSITQEGPSNELRFRGCTNLKSVVFNGKISIIPTSMFSGCGNLETLGLDWREIVSIGWGAFKDCGYDFGALDYLPNVKTIERYAFSGVQSITSIKLTSLTHIGPEAFSGCGNLESVTIDGENLKLESSNLNGPFSYCGKLRTVKFGDGVVDLSFRPFRGSANLETVEFGRGITKINDSFKGLTSLTTFIAKGEIRDIPYGLFEGCTNLRTLKLEWDKIESIGSRAFEDCGYDFGALDYLPNVKTIERYAFSGVQSITSIKLTSLTHIGPEAFSGCGNLESVTIDGENLELESSNLNGPFSYCRKLRTVKFGDGVVDLSFRPFRGSTNLETVEFGRGITKINDSFKGLSSLTTFIAKGAIRDIPYGLFEGCTNLRMLKLNWDKIESIGDRAFEDCGYDFGVLDYLPNVKTIERYAFSGVQSITSINLTSLTHVGPEAFSGCGNLESVTIDGENLELESSNLNGPFSYCRKLRTVKFGDGVVDLSFRPFRGSTNLETVEFGRGITKINDSFKGLTSLTTFIAKGEIRDIPYGLFEGCTNLRTLKLEWDKIETIGSRAFKECGYDFGVLDYLQNVKTIDGGAFQNLTTITAVKLLSPTRIGTDAFAGCANLESVEIDGENLVLQRRRPGNGPFAYCGKLRTVKFGDGVISPLPFRLFYKSPNIEEIELGKGIRKLRVAGVTYDGFANMKKLRKFTAKGDIEVLPSATFAGCEALAEIELQWNAVTNVGNSTFQGCVNWTVGKLDFLSNVKEIGSHAFTDCHKIYEAVIPETVATVFDGVFRGCRGLSNVVWEAERVPPTGFRDCTQLSTLVFGRNVKEFAADAFAGCGLVSNVYFRCPPPLFTGQFSPNAGCMARGWAMEGRDGWDAATDPATGLWKGLYMEVRNPDIDLFVKEVSIPGGSLTLGWTSDFRPPDLRYAVRRSVEGGETALIASNLVQNTASTTNVLVDVGFRSAPPFTKPVRYDVVPTLFDIELAGTNIWTRNRRAVVVGCSEPFRTNLGRRPTTAVDAADISDLLTRNGGFEARKIVGFGARKDDIRNALTNAICASKDGDYVFFYIGAHGGEPLGGTPRNDGRLVTADQYYFAREMLMDVRSNLLPRPGVAFQGVVMACHAEGIVSDDTLWKDECDILNVAGLGMCLANESWLASAGVRQFSWNGTRWSLFKKVMFDNGWRNAAADVYADGGANRSQDHRLTFGELTAYTKYLYDALPQSGRSWVFTDKMVESVANLPLGTCGDFPGETAFGPPSRLTVSKEGADHLWYRIGGVDGGAQFCLANVILVPLSGGRVNVLTQGIGMGELEAQWKHSLKDIADSAHEIGVEACDMCPKVGIEAVSVGFFTISDPQYAVCEFVDYSKWLKDKGKGTVTSLGTLIGLSAAVAANGQSLSDNYVAGLNPLDAHAKFRITSLTFKDGKPNLTYEPDLGAERTYTILGADCPEGPFGPVRGTSRFFKVAVALPGFENTCVVDTP